MKLYLGSIATLTLTALAFACRRRRRVPAVSRDVEAAVDRCVAAGGPVVSAVERMRKAKA